MKIAKIAVFTVVFVLAAMFIGTLGTEYTYNEQIATENRDQIQTEIQQTEAIPHEEADEDPPSLFVPDFSIQPLLPPYPPKFPRIPKSLGKTTVTISAVGDIMMHMPQVESARQPDGSFDFKPVFEYIKPYLEKADIALGNIETTISTPERGFYGFPRFRSPKEVVEALKYTGFDIITTSNNHILDAFTFGLEHTLNTLDYFGLKHTGAARNPEERERLLIFEKNGINIAILAYTFSTNGMEAAIDSERLRYMVIYLHETDRILNDISRAKEQGAELIIACLHWGHEYHRKQHPEQERVARLLLEAGVDIIFGAHPHVLQPMVMKTLSTEDSEKREGLVVYSMGNFVSNQRKRFRDSGKIVNVTVTKDHDLQKVYIEAITYVPTWVHRYSKGGRLHYKILPVGKALDTGLYPETHNRLNEVWKETTEHIEGFEPVR